MEPQPTASGHGPTATLRMLPNLLSAGRIIAAPVLLFLAATGYQSAFVWVLVPALLSDIADGLIARLFHLQSRLGALLDSVADTLLLFASVYGIAVFHPDVLRNHATVGAVVIGAWLLENLVALVRYGRLSSFHTYLSKIAGYLLGIFVGALFVFGFHAWLLYAAAGASVIGNCEELLLIALLPRWRADVRGAFWVLRECRMGTAT
jgi:cardiolipin synthase (CMP-forming)